MRKNKLIALLQEIPGNPEVCLWNGYVGDYMHISPKIAETDLVRMTFDYYVDMVRLSRCKNKQDWDYKLPPEDLEALSKDYPKHNDWMVGEYITQEDITEGRYKSKRVLILNAKTRGISTFDRVSGISY